MDFESLTLTGMIQLQTALGEALKRRFEVRRGEAGFTLRSVTDQTTEVDGVALPKTGAAAIRAGSKVRLAKVLTLEFLGEGMHPMETAESTKYTP